MKKKLFSVVMTLALAFSFTSGAFASTAYQAETAKLLGASKLSDDGAFVIGWDNPGDGMEFTVKAPSANKYKVEVGYATPMEGSSFLVSVNGGADTEVAITKTSDWAVTTTLITELDLKEGDNTVKITKGKEYVQLDYIKVYGEGEAVPNPATGDNGIMLYAVLAVLAGSVIVLTNRKRMFN
ncbi:MAG: CBM35 domain-containing protein [Neobacillus sp.]